MGFEGKEGDLAAEIGPVIEEADACDAAARHTAEFLHLVDHLVRPGGLASGDRHNCARGDTWK